MKKILVAACCGSCAAGGIIPPAPPVIWSCVNFFFNGDNFDTKDEYNRRLTAMLTVDKNTIVEKYIPRTFENCEQCIAYRLTRCAEYAKSRGYDCFTTTLTISPHKDTAMVNKIGRDVSAFYGVPFLELDLKKNGGFARSVEMSKKLGLYRQNYCGCARSVRK